MSRLNNGQSSQTQPHFTHPPQSQEHFTRSATHNSWERPSMIQSHWTGNQDQPNVQSIPFGSTIHTNVSSSYVNPYVWALTNNVQGFPIDANTMNTSESQSLYHGPQLLPRDANGGVSFSPGVNMHRSYHDKHA